MKPKIRAYYVVKQDKDAYILYRRRWFLWLFPYFSKWGESAWTGPTTPNKRGENYLRTGNPNIEYYKIQGEDEPKYHV